MREIVLDTETTGLDPLKGHRVVDIGCVELINHIPTGQTWQAYINPERDMPAEATAVHGLTDAFLADKPVFAQVVDDFLEFVGASPLVIHNAAFDINFINAELVRTGYKQWSLNRATDTVLLARKMFPGAPVSLDSLCKRFGIDLSGRTMHGALLDCQLLADVYLELKGGRQTGFALGSDPSPSHDEGIGLSKTAQHRSYRTPRPHSLSDEERMAHEAFLARLNDPLWKKRINTP